MNIDALSPWLWVVTLTLAGTMLGAGMLKLIHTPQHLATHGPPIIGKRRFTDLAWSLSVPPALVKFIGLAEVLGGLGLVLPQLTGMEPQLARLAAAGLAITMIGAVGLHVARREPWGVVFPGFLLALSLIIALS